MESGHPSRAMTALMALAIGVALADGSIVTLALPPLLVELEMSVRELAAVIGIYTGVVAVSLLPAERLRERIGERALAMRGLAAFGVASAICAAAGATWLLLAGRVVQGIGAAAIIVAGFALIRAGSGPGMRIWEGAAVVGFAAGPALGGALTELLDWRAIFIAQIPLALAAWLVVRSAPPLGPEHAVEPLLPPELTRGSRAERLRNLGSGVGLALVSASLTAVLFGIVLLLVAGWAETPLRAALAVSPLPLAAIPATRIGGDARLRASAGALLIAGGIASLAWIPETSLWWAAGSSALAGVGMGMALTAFTGELLPERTTLDAARLMTVRHAGITAALVVLAPIVSSGLDDAVFEVREQGVAIVLDASLPPQEKLSLAPDLLGSVDAERPRAELTAAFENARGDYEGEQLSELDALAERADDVLIAGIADAFRTTFLLTAAFALAGALAVLPRRRLWAWLAAAAVLAVAAPIAYREAEQELGPERVAIADPCAGRDLPGSGGITGFAQDASLRALDFSACRFGSSREELVLAIADGEARERFEREHGFDPLSPGGILEGLIFGGD